jgi:hypothetical protein
MLFRSSLCVLIAVLGASSLAEDLADEPGLVAYWKLQGDCRDHSGGEHHGVNHGVDLQSSSFDGQAGYIEVADAPGLRFGKEDFTITAEVYTEKGVNDVLGDIVSKFDGARRQGFNLTFASNTSGYNSQSDVRHLFFGVDAATDGEWVDCGRPGGVAHSSDALTVFEGDLYAGTSDAPDEKDWAHVYRYKGGQEWEDCGRVGDRETRGVYAMIVHDGALYAGTAGPHSGSKANTGDYGRVYRYRGGQEWDDIGQPGEHYRINSLASFRGKLYALAINTYGTHGGVYVYDGDRHWKQCGDFGRPHTSGVHNDRLYAAFPQGEVFEYDGSVWENLGNPYGSFEECNQLHSHGVFGGELYVGTWPFGKVATRRDGAWVDVGRLGDATEVVDLMAYNGSFYSGTIPRAELFRFDGPNQWTSLGRLFDPPDYNAKDDVEDWTRASSLRLFQGKLFCSTATCYRSLIEQPRPDDIRGKVFCYETGAGVSLDHDLGPGWKHVAAVRDGANMKLYVDGRLAAESGSDEAPLAVTTDAPLRIGFGPHSQFQGKIREVRIYNRALDDGQLQALAKKQGS